MHRHGRRGARAGVQREPNIVFVPAMVNLHEGHIELIPIAKPRAGRL